MLERLYVQNLPNANSVLDLSKCPSLLLLDATGSGFTGYEFADGGLINQAIINKPTSLTMRNLPYLLNDNLTIADLSALISLRFENTAGVDALAIVQAATALQVARIIGITWTLANTNMLDKLYVLQGQDDNGYTVAQSILSGSAHVPIMTQRRLDSFNEAWPSLDITYNSMLEEYPVYFLNADGTPIKDKQGNDYVQYVDRGGMAHDPIETGEVDTPTRESDDRYIYTYSGWSNLDGVVMESKNVTATYTTVEKTYAVRWYAQAGDLRKTVSNVTYGSEVVFSTDPYEFPTLTDQESVYYYKVFKGWDKSTGYVTSDLDVYAIWEGASLPTPNAIELKDMNVAQISGVVKNKNASAYWTARDYVDITVGKDYEFSNVRSEVLAEELYLDGSGIQKTDVKLFDTDSPSFTMAIDYEFASTTSNATLVSCYDASGSEGFRLRYYNSRPNIQWGDKNQGVGYSTTRGIVVIRHRKGDPNLYVASDNTNVDTYNTEILTVEIPRVQATNTGAVITFGGVPVGASGYDNPGTGTIHWCKIWYDDLGSNAIQKLACWPHETWRMEYAGANLYFLADGSGERAAATFIANASLALPYVMNTDQTSVGGWNASAMRTFVNSRVFNALPFSWQSMLKTVRVKATNGSSSGEIINSSDRVYLPCFAELAPTADETYLSEGSLIPWFTSNSLRTKFCGIIVPEGAQYITTQYDPTTLTGTYTIKDGDVWVRNNDSSRCYIYVSAAEARKHGKLGGRDKSSSMNLIAEGSQGGYWVRASAQWTRTAPVSSDNYYFYSITDYGASTLWSTANQACAVDVMFSV